MRPEKPKPSNRIPASPYDRHGFTLVELLIVLAVLSVLAALLLPAFLSARRFAQRGVCTSNMHNAALAIALYAQDYDGYYPDRQVDPVGAQRPFDQLFWHNGFCQATSLDPAQASWVSVTQPYIKVGSQTPANGRPSDLPAPANSLYFCPADGDRLSRPNTSFEYKMLLADHCNEASVSVTSQMVMLWEQWAFHTGGKDSEHDRRSQMMMAFLDGHVHWIRMDQTASARLSTGPDLHWGSLRRGNVHSEELDEDLPQ